jgi:hypothetical protein
MDDEVFSKHDPPQVRIAAKPASHVRQECGAVDVQA